MKRSLLAISCIVAILSCSSCGDKVIKGEGSMSTQSPKVGPFTSVQVEMPLKVTITVRKGAKPSLRYTGYYNLMAHIKTKVENNILFIGSDLDNRIAIEGKDV